MGKTAKKKLPQADAPASLMLRLAALQREFEEQLRQNEREAGKTEVAAEIPDGTASPDRTGDL